MMMSLMCLGMMVFLLSGFLMGFLMFLYDHWLFLFNLVVLVVVCHGFHLLLGRFWGGGGCLVFGRNYSRDNKGFQLYMAGFRGLEELVDVSRQLRV